MGPFQNSFLAGRGTSEKILIVQEMVHTLMNLNPLRKGGSMILKLEI